MGKWESVPLPDQWEKQQSIRAIVRLGMPAPRRLSRVLPDLLRTVGLGRLFFGVGDCLFLAALASGLLGFALFASLGGVMGTLYGLVFLVSPFLYGALHLLTTWKEILCGTYELTMTCRCNLRQLTVLRMLVFGGMSAVMSTLAVIGLSAVSHSPGSFLRLLSVSFSSLFLFAAAQLAAEWKSRSIQAYFIVPAIWLVLCMALLSLGERGERLFAAIPTLVFCAVAAVSLACYLSLLRRYCFEPREGGTPYAVG